jgi:hypothetical protein
MIFPPHTAFLTSLRHRVTLVGSSTIGNDLLAHLLRFFFSFLVHRRL